MKHNEFIVDVELLSKYEYYAWEIVCELRAADDLDYKKIEEVLNILENMVNAYEGKDQIDKLVAETFESIPETIIDIGKVNIVEGKEIQIFGYKYSKFRDLILEENIDSKHTMVNKEIIDEFKENSIGETGIFRLIKKNNKLDMEKVKKIFKSLSDMVKIYEDYYVIDKEIVKIIISINSYLYEENLQTNEELLNNFVVQFEKYKRKLFEIKK